MDQGSSTRDGKGRFQTGHPGGPGRPHGRQSELRRAVEEAVAPEHLAAIMRRTARMALEGNLTAVRIVLDRACGKTTDSAVSFEPLGIELPKLLTAADCSAALDKLIKAICDGAVDHDMGKLLIEAIQARLKAVETQDHENRLAALEESAAVVDLGRHRRA